MFDRQRQQRQKSVDRLVEMGQHCEGLRPALAVSVNTSQEVSSISGAISVNGDRNL